MSSDGKKREELRWFPADNISDCDAEPGLEQVKFGLIKFAAYDNISWFNAGCVKSRAGISTIQ